MFDTEDELIYNALNMWGNKIETGDTSLSQKDVINMLSTMRNKPEPSVLKKLKSLTDEQERLVRRIRNLARDYQK